MKEDKKDFKKRLIIAIIILAVAVILTALLATKLADNDSMFFWIMANTFSY